MAISEEDFNLLPDEYNFRKRIVDSMNPYGDKKEAYTKDEIFNKAFGEDLKEDIDMDDFNTTLRFLVKNGNLEKRGKYYLCKIRYGHEKSSKK